MVSTFGLKRVNEVQHMFSVKEFKIYLNRETGALGGLNCG